MRLRTLAIFLTTLCVAASASAQVPDSTRATYLREVHQAVERLVAGQTQGAETVLRNALERLPDAPEAYCVQASLQRLQGQLDTALETYERCATLGRQAGDAKSEGSGLLGQLNILLTMEGRIDDARQATMALLRFAEAHPRILSEDIPRDRLRTIDLIVERDAAARAVRLRREARQRENAESDD